jgi:hypothetical protein
MRTRRKRLGDLGIDRRVLLKCILKEYGVRLCGGCNRLRIASSGSCEHRNKPSGTFKMRGNFTSPATMSFSRTRLHFVSYVLWHLYFVWWRNSVFRMYREVFWRGRVNVLCSLTRSEKSVYYGQVCMSARPAAGGRCSNFHYQKTCL